MALTVENLSKVYHSASGEEVVALEDMNIEIDDGEVVTIIGQSGCGKSTLLHCLGGLLSPSSGSIKVDDVPVTGPDPKLAAFVFQDYSLLPWKSIVDNASIGLRFAGESKKSAHKNGMEMLSLVGLTEYAHAYPYQLSGGMQQRVAVARAMAMNPRMLLMDEPFGALDEQTRRHLGFEMASMLSANKSTVVLVTHSLDEAILWADRIIVLKARPGKVMREIRIPEPRPRALECMQEPWFNEIRAELFGLLESPIGSANAATAEPATAQATSGEQ